MAGKRVVRKVKPQAGSDKAETALRRLTTALLANEPRHLGSKYICPTHDDRNPSLNVSLKNGQVLIHCFAGCDPKRVLAALGMKWSDLYALDGTPTQKGVELARPEPLPSTATLKLWRNNLFTDRARLRYWTKERGVSEAVLRRYGIGWDAESSAYTFPYTRDGELVNVKKVRPGSTGQKKKVWWHAKNRPVDFLWPEDQLASNFLVLTEGEGDAMRLITEAVPAVTVPHGGGQGKWKPGYARSLINKRVGITTDCDQPGRALAEEAGESIAALAATVRVLDLDPERDDGFDITDWFQEQGHDREQFLELFKSAPVQVPHRLVVVSAWDRLQRMSQEPPPHWLFRPVFLHGTYGVLAGPPKALKSWDVAATVVSAASGHALWGLLPVDEPCEVIYFVGEDDERLTLQRLEAICRWLSADPREVLSRIHVAEAVPRFGDERDLKIVQQQLELHSNVAFTALDPMYLAVPGAEGRQLFDMAGLLGAIQHVVVTEARSGLLIAHHWNEAGKGTGPERMSGAGPAEWGRVLLSGSPEPAVAQPDFFIKYGIAYEVSGSRIPKMKLAVERFLKQEDSDDPASPYAYRAQGQFIEGGRTALSPADREVLAALSWDEPATVAELLKIVNTTRRRSKEKALHRRSVEKALNDLKGWNLAAHDDAERDRRWRRIDVRGGQARNP